MRARVRAASAGAPSGRYPDAWRDLSAPTCGTSLMGAHFPGPTAGPRRLQAAMGTPKSQESEPRRVRIADDGVNASVPAIVCEQEYRGVGPPNAFAHQLRADAVLVSLPRARQLDALVRCAREALPPLRFTTEMTRQSNMPQSHTMTTPTGPPGASVVATSAVTCSGDSTPHRVTPKQHGSESPVGTSAARSRVSAGVTDRPKRDESSTSSPLDAAATTPTAAASAAMAEATAAHTTTARTTDASNAATSCER